MRVGAIIAEGAQDIDRFCRFGWYFGAAFQIQDDVLNLTADYAKYGKEIGGDLYEGKRTLMPIRLLSRSRPAQRRALERFLMKSRAERTSADVEWVHGLMLEGGAIEYARRKARQLAAGVHAPAAVLEALATFRGGAGFRAQAVHPGDGPIRGESRSVTQDWPFLSPCRARRLALEERACVA